MKKLYFLFSSTIVLFFCAVLNLNAQNNDVVRDLVGRNVFELKNVSVSNLTIKLKEFSNDIYFVDLNKG